MKIIPDRKEDFVPVPGATKYLDERIINQPTAALHLVTKEAMKDLKKSIKIIHDMYEYALEVMVSGSAAGVKMIQKKKECI